MPGRFSIRTSRHDDGPFSELVDMISTRLVDSHPGRGAFVFFGRKKTRLYG